MKKFQFLTAAGVALVLASCSSDTPDYNPQPGPAENTGDMYITLNLGMASDATRASNANGVDDERKVKNIYVALYADKGLTTNYIEKSFVIDNDLNLTGTDSDETGATFDFSENLGEIKISVDPGLYTVIKNAGTLSYVVAANVSDATIGKDSTTDKLYETGETNFVMGGAGHFTVQTGTGDGTKDNPLVITPDTDSTEAISLIRVAAKLNFEDCTLNEGNNATKNQSIEMNLDGVAICNENNEEYTLPHYNFASPSIFSEDGSLFAKDHSAFTVGVLEDNGYNYGSTKDDKYKYIFPLSFNNSSVTPTYADLTYIAFKMLLPKVNISSYVTGEGKYIYSYKGALIGTSDKLKNIDSSDENLGKYKTVLAGIYANADNAYKADNSSSLDTELGKLVAQYPGFYQFELKGDNYEVFYFHPVRTDMTGTVTNANAYNKFKVLRNHIYDITINSLVKFGYPGSYKPDVLIPEDEPDNFIDLKFKVAPWTVVGNAYDLQ